MALLGKRSGRRMLSKIKTSKIETSGAWNNCSPTRIYISMKKPMCPMHPIGLENVRSSSYFDDVVEVTYQMGLHPLMVLQCNYNITLVQQFCSILVIKGDDAQTMRWMSGPTPGESNFYRLVIYWDILLMVLILRVTMFMAQVAPARTSSTSSIPLRE
jgi:hypothetical protein